MNELQERGVLTEKERKYLEQSYLEALDAIAGKSPSEKLVRKRYASMIADKDSSELVRVLADLAQSVITNAKADDKDSATGVVLKATVSVPEPRDTC